MDVTKEEDKNELDKAYKIYKSVIIQAGELRETYLIQLAKNKAQEGNTTAEKYLQQKKGREEARASSRRIKYDNGKLDDSKLTSIKIQREDGMWKE